MLSVAEPLPLSVALPSVITPSLKVTVPVGNPKPGTLDVTIAVKVTFSPKTDGSESEETVVVVASLLTVSITIADVLAETTPSPA